MVLPFWWLGRLTEQTRLLLAGWLTCVRALLGMFHLPAFLMSFVTSNVLIPCLSKDPRVLPEFQLLQRQMEERVSFQRDFKINFHFTYPKCCSFQKELPSFIPRYLSPAWSNVFKMTGLLIFLLVTAYATFICKDTFLELVHTYFKAKIIFLPLPAADVCPSISFPGIQLIHMQSKKILLPLRVAFTATVTKINFHYFLI